MGVKNILVTDDADILHVLEESFLGRGGFNVLKAKTAEEAFHLMEENDLFASVVSLEMPGAEDGTFLQRVKTDPLLGSTPLVAVLSQSPPSYSGEKALDTCDAILHKPLNKAELQSTLCRLFGGYERKFTRYDVSLELFLDTDNGKSQKVKVLNISLGGVFIKAEELFPVGTSLTLRGDLSETAQAVSIQVKTAWVNHPEWLKTTRWPRGMGLEFVSCPKSVKEFLEGLQGGTD